MSKGSIPELYKGLISNTYFDEVSFGYHFNCSDKEFKKGREYLEFTIESLNKQSDEAVLEEGKSYYKNKIYANPILLAWHCLKLKMRELQERNKQLEKLLDEARKQRDLYAERQGEFIKVAAGRK